MGALCVLLSELRRLRRILDLSAQPAARSVSTGCRRMPDFAPPGSSCWRRCCVRSAAVCRTRSVARAFCRSSSSAWFRLRCCWPGRRCCRSRSARWDARRCSGSRNGAVFKLVPQYFPAETGTVTGLVGAMGGLGGFFPPLLLGVFRDRLGVVWPGFVSAGRDRRSSFGSSTAGCFCPAKPHVVRSRRPGGRDRFAPAPGQRCGPRLLVAAIVVGSRNLRELRCGAGDLHVRRYFRHVGRCLSLQRLAGEAAHARLLGSRLGTVPERGAISTASRACRKSRPRTSLRRASSASAPLCAGGCTNAFSGDACSAMAITFPLVFGWIAFGSCPDNQMIYVTYLFGFPAGQFPLRTSVCRVAVSWSGHRGGSGADRSRTIALAADAR